jgi:hypothetical protein
MARPLKNNADYFSHDNNMRDDERIKAVRRKYSHVGYSTWNMLLERLCRAEDFRIEYNEESRDIMAGDFNIDPDELKSILDYFIKLKLIVNEDGYVFSKTMLTRFEGLFRKRKRDVEKLSLAITPTALIIADDNTQSKVKKSKVNQSKENEIKEKGNREVLPPVFLNDVLCLEKEEGDKNLPLQKSCAKKVITDALLINCKAVFDTFAPQYVWEDRNNAQLEALLHKIQLTKPEISNAEEWADALVNFIKKLPDYWRTKKFTVPNLCMNYNEIVNEIRANNLLKHGKHKTITPATTVAKTTSVAPPVTAEALAEARKQRIASICEMLEHYVNTGDWGFVPLFTLYDTLVNESVLDLDNKALQKFRAKAIAQRKAELNQQQQSKNTHDARKATLLLANVDVELSKGNELHRIDNAVKTLAVQALFERVKKKQIHINHLFTL